MLAKKIVLGFGIAMLLPMMVYYGVSTFSPKPEYRDYQIENYREKHDRASTEEKAELEEQKSQLNKQRREHEKRFQRHLFFVAAPLGIIAVIAGSIIAVQAIGTGFMLGGIITLSEGYVCYWPHLEDWMRFTSLVIGFIVLVFIGYRKLTGKEKPKQQ
ncbi:MAG: hypothetical protein ACYSSI_03265 [Planctomycetota bacterium]|jgi:hypothetical protein